PIGMAATMTRNARRSGAVPRAAPPAAGWYDGTSARIAAATTRPRAASAANAARQPACWPTQGPSRAPRHGAGAGPIAHSDTTPTRTLAGHRPVTAGAAIDQNRAWVIAVTSRAAASTG